MNKNTKNIILIVFLSILKIVSEISFVAFIMKNIEKLFLFLFCIFIFFIYLVGGIVTPLPEIPKEKQGKFPFEIVYSVNGEQYRKEGTFVCKCKTAYIPFATEKYWYWSSNLKKEDSDVLCEINGTKIYFDCGKAEYYMVLPETSADYTPGQYIYYQNSDGYHKLNLQEAKEQLGIEIISAKFSDPIENEFEYRTVDKIRLFLTGGEKDN